MTQPKQRDARVSVITRTKDRPSLLRRAIRSIAEQTFSDFELVVVNDAGETAAVREILDAFAAVRPEVPVKLVENETPSGRGKAINDGLAVASAPLYVLHDDDDTWQPQFLEKTVQYLEAHPDHVAVATRTWVIYEEQCSEEMVETGREILAEEATSINLIDTARRNIAPPICLVIRRMISDAVGGFDDAKPTQEDWDLLLRLLVAGPVGMILGDPLANWHHRAAATGSMSNSVYGEGTSHQNFAAAIREQYLREPEDRELGLLLAAAQYANELHGRMDGLGEAVSVHHEARVGGQQQLQQVLAAQSERIERLEALVLGLAANLQEAHKKLDRIGSSAPSRFLRRLSKKIEPAAPVAPAASVPQHADGSLVIPPAPRLTGSRWLDDEEGNGR